MKKGNKKTPQKSTAKGKEDKPRITIYEREDRHIRGHKDKVKGEIKYHPNYIFGETKADFYSYGITESEKYDSRHKNTPLDKNPKKGDKRPAYIHKKARHDRKGNYTSPYNDFSLGESDKKRIDDKIDAKYKK